MASKLTTPQLVGVLTVARLCRHTDDLTSKTRTSRYSLRLCEPCKAIQMLIQLSTSRQWCGGSSVGPAVSIASGFCPLAIGTETGGSNVFPASVNGLYGLTLPHGSVPTDGVCRISEFADRVGLMARDPHDIISLATVLLADTATVIQDVTQPRDTWKNLSIGILDSEWGIDPSLSWKWGSAEVVRYTRTQRTAFPADHGTERKVRLRSRKAEELGGQDRLPAANSSAARRTGTQWRKASQRILSVPARDHGIHPICQTR